MAVSWMSCILSYTIASTIVYIDNVNTILDRGMRELLATGEGK